MSNFPNAFHHCRGYTRNANSPGHNISGVKIASSALTIKILGYADDITHFYEMKLSSERYWHKYKKIIIRLTIK